MPSTDPQKRKEYAQKYYQEHKDKLREQAKERWKNNPQRPHRYKTDAKYRKYVDQWRKENKDKIHATTKKCRNKLKNEIINAYGGKCACCDEGNDVFLTIDHTNGGGNQHRKEIGSDGGTSMYYWLKRNNYPNGFRVLCWNCNAAHAIMGRCPHKEVQ